MEQRLRSAPIKLVFWIIITIFIFDFIFILLELFEEFVLFDLSAMSFAFVSYSTLIHIALIFVQVLLILYQFLLWYTSYYLVKNEYVLRSSGLIVKRKKIVNYANVRSANYEQGVLGRIFNYGNVSLELIGKGNGFVMASIDSPGNVVERIEKYVGDKNNS